MVSMLDQGLADDEFVDSIATLEGCILALKYAEFLQERCVEERL